MAITSIEDLGEALALNRSEGIVTDLPFRLISSEAAAEGVQDAAIMASNDNVVGYFATATTPTTQRLLQCDMPIFGPLVSSVVVSDHAHFSLPLGVLGAECSFGFIVGAPYPDPHADISLRSLQEVVIGCLPMITILGRRMTKEAPLNSWTATADFALHVASVKGRPVFDMHLEDLSGIKVIAGMNGAIVGHTNGESVMGHPVNAVLWLAEALNRCRRQLSAGSIIAIGAGPLILQAVVGQTFRADFGSMGSVDVTFD